MYPSDEAFARDVATATFTGANIPRYILRSLECGTANPDKCFDDGGSSIEHVLPRSDQATGWDQFGEEDYNRMRDRLANMILIPQKLDRAVDTSPYSQKRLAYLDSRAPTAVAFAKTYENWTPQDLRKRGKAMARKATSLWSIDFPAGR